MKEFNSGDKITVLDENGEKKDWHIEEGPLGALWMTVATDEGEIETVEWNPYDAVWEVAGD